MLLNKLFSNMVSLHVTAYIVMWKIITLLNPIFSIVKHLHVTTLVT